MLFRQLFDLESSTYTYLLGDEQTGEAALVDPVLEHVDRDLLFSPGNRKRCPLRSMQSSR
jgi:hypothetical protein